ncbi:tyrosine-type recombinase/integrase [Agaribacter marinus]|uniref:Tyrosine-type recombinase/integrase n=1 Tax=Virgibacillus salarius TaxID=447199 RepID=A0A941E3S9_9BACI|nr:tyrosine-type recombinase/integrase [Virgibacillus salarius]MBR7798293.1 tyrosine-type recombinase/integrase [Virgibacillus salarius]NAZ11002.1 tyrosine-type recombinase/integrase [Agaribacter marinus]
MSSFSNKKNSKRRSNNLNVQELDMITETPKKKHIPFGEALERFLDDCEIRNLRSHTIKFYRNELGHFYKILKEQGIDTAPNNVTSEIIKRNIIVYLKEKEARTVSINTKLRAIRAFFNFLYNEGAVKKNPVKGIQLLKDRQKAVATFTNEQLDKLFKQPDLRTFTGVRDYTILSLLLETGIRANECVHIRLKDISPSNILIRHTKGYKERFVPITDNMYKLLKKYLAVRGTVENDYLFITIDETPLSKRQLQNRITKYGKDAKIEGVRCSAHTFRHTFAKLSVKAGADIFTLQAILGHTSMEMVRNYVNLFSEDVLEKHKNFSPLKNVKGRI